MMMIAIIYHFPACFPVSFTGGATPAVLIFNVKNETWIKTDYIMFAPTSTGWVCLCMALKLTFNSVDFIFGWDFRTDCSVSTTLHTDTLVYTFLVGESLTPSLLFNLSKFSVQQRYLRVQTLSFVKLILCALPQHWLMRRENFATDFAWTSTYSLWPSASVHTYGRWIHTHVGIRLMKSLLATSLP